MEDIANALKYEVQRHVMRPCSSHVGATLASLYLRKTNDQTRASSACIYLVSMSLDRSQTFLSSRTAALHNTLTGLPGLRNRAETGQSSMKTVAACFSYVLIVTRPDERWF